MTFGRHVSTTVSALALLLVCHLGCGGSAPVKKASTTGVYTPDEKGEDKIKVSAADPSSRPAAKPTPEPVRTVAAEAQPVAAAQPATGVPADGKVADADADAEAAPADEDEAAEKPAPVKKARKAKKSKKHKKSKKRRR